jgi:hypothetical protein
MDSFFELLLGVVYFAVLTYSTIACWYHFVVATTGLEVLVYGTAAGALSLWLFFSIHWYLEGR